MPDKILTDFRSTLISNFDQVYLIIAPPRSGSTALARIFWEHPNIGCYCHEPFEVNYYFGDGLEVVVQKLTQSVDLKPIKKSKFQLKESGLLIKDMPYQIGSHFANFAPLITKPVIFLVRDPRLNISSRMDKLKFGGESPFFPLIESGWTVIRKQVEQCRLLSIPYLILDASDLRNFPEIMIQKIFKALEIPFYEEILTWQPVSMELLKLDNLGGKREHFYRRVLESTNIQPASEPIPPVFTFPKDNDFRIHVRKCLEIYYSLHCDPEMIHP